MKIFLALSMLLGASTSFAELAVDIQNKSYLCEKKTDSLFHCQSGANSILVTKIAMGYAAFQKNSDGFPEMKWISKVVDDGKVLFEIPKMNFAGMEGIYKTPESKAGKLISANSIVSNLKDIDDDLARQFIAESKSFIDREAAPKPKIRILADDKKFDCVRGEDRKLTEEEKKYEAEYNTKLQCNFYACKGSNGEKILSFVPVSSDFASPYFLNLKGTQTELRFNGLKVVEPDNQKEAPIYDIPAWNGAGYTASPLDENLFVPSQFENNKSAFSFFTNPMTESMREGALSRCAGNNDVTKLIAEEKKIAETFQQGLVNAELSHYLTLVNGQVISVFVDAKKAQGLGCRYDGMILSKDAEKHIEFLQKAKPKPIAKYLTEEEVQDLFQQAKNMADIPFGYKYDGCYARAHVMARRFEAMGIPVEKVWIKGSLFVPGTDVQWNYHVAPVINVKTKNGDIKKYVIDPSLTAKAVTVDGWVESMGKKVKGGVVETPYPFPVNVANFQRTAVAFSSSDVYVPDNDEKRSEAENMALAIQTMKEYTEALNEKNQNENEYENENQHVRPDVI